jgi:tetratricopeptide (TPR) repeat protein
MTNNLIPVQISNTSVYDDRVDILFRELELAIRWQRPSILLAIFNSEHIHNEVESALKNRLLSVSQDVHSVKIDGEDNSDIPQYLTTLPHLEKKVIFVHGFNLGGGQENSRAYRALNIGRDYFINRQVRVVFWLTTGEANDLAHHAPEFWGYRHRVVEFLEQIDPAHSPLRTLGSTWQGIGEFAEPHEDIDNRIALRDSLLAELPEKSESTSVRANLMLSLGVLHWRKGDYEKAIGFSQTALQLATKIEDKWFEAMCFNSLALIQANSGKVSEAIDALKQASSLTPDQIFPWNNLGNLFSELDRFDEAMDAFQTAMQLNPTDPMGLNGLGNVYLKLGRTNEAMDNFQKAIQVSPNFAHPWNGLGNVFAKMDQIESAISAFQKAVDLDHHLALPWINLGSIYEKLNRNEDAADAFQKAFELDPANAVVWNEQGKIYLNAGSVDEAVCAFQKSIELDEGNGWSYCNLAQTYVCKGKYSEAIQLYHKSLRLFKSNTEKAITWSKLGNVYQQKNDMEKAVSAKQIAIELDPENEKLRDELIEVHNSLNLQSPSGDQASEAGKSMQNSAIHRFLVDAGMESEFAVTPNEQSNQVEPALEARNTLKAREWNEHGNALLNTGAYPEASKAYQKAIELDSSFGWPYANKALIACNNGKYNEAVSLYQKSFELLNSKQEQAVIWNRLGNVYRKQSDYVKAIQAHRKTLELDPQNRSARRDLILIHNDLGQIKETIDLLTASLDKASAWNMLGNAYRRLSDYAFATEAFQKAVDLAPNDYAFKFDLEESIKDSLHKVLPSKYKKQNTGREDIEEIKKALKEAGEASPHDEDQPGPFGELIDLQASDESHSSQGKELPSPETELQPSFPVSRPARVNTEYIPARRTSSGVLMPAYLSGGGEAIVAVGANQMAGTSYRNMWHLDETMSTFQKVTESLPVESLDPALLVYQRAVELVSVDSGNNSFVDDSVGLPPSPPVYSDSAPTIINPRLRRPLEFIVAQPESIPETIEEAPAEVQQEENPPAPEPVINQGTARTENNDAAKLERDIITYKTVTGINPKNARAWHTLGNLQRSAGQYAEATDALEKAVELDPRQEVFHYHLGLVYAAQNRYEEAIESFKKVITINPEYNLAHATLAGYYLKLGFTSESEKHMAIARRTMQNEKEYNQACFEAICGNVDKAIELLKVALKQNQTSLDWVRRDPDFENIRGDERFQALVAG